ncbi:MAG: hypothetical protein V4682_01115 [Patescibacteria group bacterium]
MNDNDTGLTPEIVVRLVLLVVTGRDLRKKAPVLSKERLDSLFESYLEHRHNPLLKTHYPFSDAEWDVLADADRIWAALLNELDVAERDLPQDGLRPAVTVDVGKIDPAWRELLSQSRSCQSCFLEVTRRLILG